MAAQAEQAKLKKRLEALLKLPENQICADCKKRGPRWASANLGVFFCIECSGIHRNLGVHISFVRSVNLDSWTKAQVDYLEEWGNARANEYYEANIPPNVHRPKEGDSVRVIEKFIRDKYEHKRFIAKTIPPKRETTPTEEEEDGAPSRRRSTLNTKKAVSAPSLSRPVAASSGLAKATPSPSIASAPAEAPSLIDFMDDPVPPPPVPSAAPAVSSPQQPQQQQAFPSQSPQNGANAFGNEWGSFATAPPAAPQPQAGFGFDAPAQQSADIFSSFTSAPAAAPAAPAQPPKAQASADAILSLYGGAPQQVFNQQGGGWGQQPMNVMGGMYQPQPGGFPQHGGMPGYPQQQMGGYPMNVASPPPQFGGFGQPQQQPHMGYPAYQQPQQPMYGNQQHAYGGQPQQQPMYGQQQPTNPFAQQQMGMGGHQPQFGSPAGYPPVNPFQQQQPQPTAASQYPFPNGFGTR